MTLIVATPGYGQWDQVAALIRSSFADMEPRLGYPAKAVSVEPGQLAEAASRGSAFLILDNAAPVACLFCCPSRDIADALYLGWLAVADHKRGQGLARRLVNAAVATARTEGLRALTLDTGKPLVELHDAFRRLGFELTMPIAETPGDIVTLVRDLDNA